MVIKKTDDKIINLNPTFIYPEIEYVFSGTEVFNYLLAILLLFFIIITYWYFYKVELIFLKNYFFSKNVLSKEESEELNKRTKDLNNIFKSTLIKKDDKYFIVNENGDIVSRAKKINNNFL